VFGERERLGRDAGVDAGVPCAEQVADNVECELAVAVAERVLLLVGQAEAGDAAGHDGGEHALEVRRVRVPCALAIVVRERIVRKRRVTYANAFAALIWR
jgi:hypothetical protein